MFTPISIVVFDPEFFRYTIYQATQRDQAGHTLRTAADGKKNKNGGSPGGTLASSAYDWMRQDILNGDLKPGTRLRMQSLSERYSVGNSPIREALNRLAVERLIIREDQKGFSVPEISKVEAAELVKTRCWLEALAVRESVQNATQEWEEKLVLAYHRLSRTPRSEDPDKFRRNPEWKRLHYDFHMSLIENCGSRWLYAYCEQLFALAERYRNASVATDLTQRNSDEEHRAILDAAVDGNAEETVRLTLEHIQKTTTIIFDGDGGPG